MDRPLILLDVDGPLNPHDAKPHRRPEGYKTLRLRPKGWEHARKPLRVWLAEWHGPALLSLAEETGAELVWATTWEHDANTLIGPEIGLSELPVIEFDDHPTVLRTWKYGSVLKFAEGRPLLWFDDDFRSVRFAPARDEFLAARGDLPTLLHYVDSRIGLTELDFAQAGRRLTKLSG